MESRGERRGFMETMRAFFTTIRRQIGQRRTRQRTNNYRICRNLAMAKIESKKERQVKKAKVTKGNASGKRKIQEKDGAPRGLHERMLSALRAFREGRKPHWVGRRGWRKNMDGLNAEDMLEAGEHLCGTHAREDIQTPVQNVQIQPCSEIHAREDIQADAGEDIQTWAGQNPQTQASLENQAREDIHKIAQDHQTQAGDDIQDQAGENLHDTQASPDTQARVDIQTQAGDDLQTQSSPEIPAGEDIQTKAGENLHETQAGENPQGQTEEELPPAEPASWVVGYSQMWQKMAVAQQRKMAHDDGVLYREDSHDTQTMGDIQATEPASWVVAYGQMWQSMAQQDHPVLCIEDCHDTKASESLDEILAREGLEACEPASWFMANAQVWGNTHTNSGVFYSMPIMTSWLSSENMQGWVNTSPYEHMDVF